MNKMMEQIDLIKKWHHDRNLIDGSNDRSQVTKLKEELYELETSVVKGESPIDDIGDMLVVLINIAERNELNLLQCMEHAYEEIKDRGGIMVDGIFIKEQDIQE